MAQLEIKHTTQSEINYIYLFKNMKHNQDRLVVGLVDQTWEQKNAKYILMYLEALRQNTRHCGLPA